MLEAFEQKCREAESTVAVGRCTNFDGSCRDTCNLSEMFLTSIAVAAAVFAVEVVVAALAVAVVAAAELVVVDAAELVAVVVKK